MDIFFIFNVALMIISIIGFVLFYNVIKQPDKWKSIILSVIASGLYLLCDIIFLLSPDPVIQSRMLEFRLVLFVFIATMWFVFITNFTNNKKRRYYSLLIAPAIVFLIYLVDPLTNLLTYVSLNGAIGYGYSSLVIFCYGVVLFLIPIIHLYKFYKINGRIYRNMVIFSAILPISVIIVKIVTNAIVYSSFHLDSIILCLVPYFTYMFYNSSRFDIKHYSRKDFLKNLNVGICFVGVNNEVIQFNDTFENFFEIDLYKGISFNVILDYLGLNIGDISDYFNSEGYFDFNYPKSDKWYQIYKKNLYDNDEYIGVIFTVYNITDMKRYEDKISDVEAQLSNQNKVLSEKYEDTLNTLQDVNHRIKINLDLLVSLINAAERYDKDVGFIMDNLVKHISLMSSIYENTYHNNYFSLVNLSDFIKEIIYLYDTGDVDIVYDLDEDIKLSIEILTPLSIIINELLNNAFKYGLSGSRDDKRLDLILKRAPNSIYMIIKDNGEGLPDDVDIYDYSTFGFAISYALIQQLNGDLTKVGVNGAGFKIDFRV